MATRINAKESSTSPPVSFADSASTRGRYCRRGGLRLSLRVRDLNKAPLLNDSNLFEDYRLKSCLPGPCQEKPLYEVVYTDVHRLLGIRRNSDIADAIKQGHFVTAQEKDELEKNRRQTSIDFFRPFWGVIRCKYNLVLANDFADYFQRAHPEVGHDREEITASFLRRLGELSEHISPLLIFSMASN